MKVNEATYQTLEQHSNFYVIYLSNKGKWPQVTRFVKLLTLWEGTTKSMYEVVIGELKKMDWTPLNRVAIGTDGASSMTHIVQDQGLECVIRF